MCPQREPGFSASLHNEFVANDKQKIGIFLIPQPPRSLGSAKVVHFDRGIPSPFLLAVQRKQKHFFSEFCEEFLSEWQK